MTCNIITHDTFFYTSSPALQPLVSPVTTDSQDLQLLQFHLFILRPRVTIACGITRMRCEATCATGGNFITIGRVAMQYPTHPMQLAEKIEDFIEALGIIP